MMYRVLFEDLCDGVRYVRTMTIEEASTHAFNHHARIVSWRKVQS